MGRQKEVEENRGASLRLYQLRKIKKILGLPVSGRAAGFQPEEERPIVFSLELSKLEAYLNRTKSPAFRAAYAVREAGQQKDGLAA